MNQRSDGRDGPEGFGFDEADADVMGELRHAGRLEPVPAEAVAAAKAAIIWRTIDAELAELTYDSSLDDEALAGARSNGPGARLLTFEAPGLTVEVEAIGSGDRRRLIGQLVPPQPGQIEVRHGGGTITVSADAVGRFSARDVLPGPVSLRCDGSAEGAHAVITDWVLV